MGVVFLLAIGIIVVLSVFMMSQMSVQQSTGREIGAMGLGGRAQLACESCVNEASYRIAFQAGNEDEETEAWLALRSFAQKEELEPSYPSPYSGSDEYLLALPFKAPLTEESYREEQDLSFHRSTVGLRERKGFPGERELWTRDHQGLLGFEQEVEVTPPYGGFDMRVTTRFMRAYRALMVGVSPPFSSHSVMIGESPGDGNAFQKYYEAFLQFRDRWVAAGRAEADLEFPIENMEGSTGRFYVTSQPLAPIQGWTMEALDADPGSWAEDEFMAKQDQIATFATNGWRRLEPRDDEELVQNLAIYSTAGLGNRSTFEVENMADLAGFFGDGGKLTLEGVIKCKGPVILDGTFEGRAILWTPSSAGITIRSLEPASGAEEASLVLVATEGDIEIESDGTGGPVFVGASLLAPQGTVRGLDEANIVGHLLMKRFPQQRMERGPRVTPPPLTERFLATPDTELGPEERQQIEIFFDPGFVRKDSRRRRIKKGLFGG